ncbi:type II secretion system minor pseudopilin GspJ [Erwiniaceae bacterium CAU 1747]
MKQHAQRGFTLIEMMLAIVLFAMLSLTALTVFKGVLKNSEITHRKSTQLTQLQRALAVIERDFTHAVARVPVGYQWMPTEADFRVQPASQQDKAYQIMLVRSGWQNHDGRLPRSTLERVRYRWQQGQLERLSYPDLSLSSTAVRSVLLLPEVTQFRLRFYDRGEWLAQWRAGGVIPQAVEIIIETPALGEVRRIIALSAAGQ